MAGRREADRAEQSSERRQSTRAHTLAVIETEAERGSETQGPQGTRGTLSTEALRLRRNQGGPMLICHLRTDVDFSSDLWGMCCVMVPVPVSV
jgi:hypothetical protein